MSIKTVILFQAVTDITSDVPSPAVGYSPRQHIGGWTESVFFPSDSVTDLVSALTTTLNGHQGLLPRRAALLPSTASIVGVRLYQGGAGRGQSRSYSYPGIWVGQQDIPQMALLCKAPAATSIASRRFTLRSIPDNQVLGGEWKGDTNTFGQLVAQYFDSLSNFGFFAVDPATPVLNIFNITTGGVVTTITPSIFVIGDIVTINRTLDATGRLNKFTGVVTAIGPLANNFTIATWNLGPCTGGTVSKKGKQLFTINGAGCTVSRIVTRRVGRPSELYRGRRSKRRKVA